ncbi:hypothetical protein ACFL3V_04815 [Nanoarchaeota archaeon]
MAKETKRGAALATIVATALGITAEGCYMDPPFVYIRVDDSRFAEGPVQRVRQREVLPPRHSDVKMTSEECRVYAKSIADSIRSNPNRRFVRICTENNPNLPRHMQHQTTEVSEFTIRTRPRKVPSVDVYALDRALGKSIRQGKRRGRSMFHTIEEGGMTNVTYFALNKDGADYLIACYFSRPTGSKRPLQGTCVLDGSGSKLDGRVDAIYKGPHKKGRTDIPKCLMKKSRRGNLKSCIPFKSNSSNYAQQQYRNISQRALYYARRR